MEQNFELQTVFLLQKEVIVQSLYTVSQKYVHLFIFTARAYARAVLGVVILSVRLSVRLSHAWIVTHERAITLLL